MGMGEVLFLVLVIAAFGGFAAAVVAIDRYTEDVRAKW